VNSTNSDSKPVSVTWYCPGGHNVFDSSSYNSEDPPECASCGAMMTTESSCYDDVHQMIEDREIYEFEQKTKP